MDWSDIDNKLGRSKTKYQFYFGDYDYQDYSKGKIARKLPKQHIGWGKRAIDIRSNKTVFDKFENDTLGLNEIFKKYKVIEAFDKIKDDILVCGCGFLALAGDRVYPFTAEEATGTFDWRDQNLSRGVAVYRRETNKASRLRPVENRPNAYIEYNKNYTVSYEDGVSTVELNTTGRPYIGLLTHQSTAKRPFGQSVLTPAAISAIIDASRTIRQAMVAAYHYNTKVDVILGADNESAIEKVEGQVGDVLKIGPNGDGGIPQIGQFAQHAMTPFTDTIATAARNFCADTKLSLANLSITTNAPQSTEALEIINDDLRDDIIAWEKELGGQLKYFAVTLWMMKNDVRTIDDNLQEKIDAITPVFMSIYKQDVGKFGDGLVKITQQAPAIVESRTLWRNLGLTSDEIDAVIASATRNSV